MNAFGLTLLWVALQVSVFCLAGIGVYLAARRRNPAAGAWTAGAALVVAVAITAVALSPWPRWWTVDASLGTLAAQPNGAADRTATATLDARLAPGMMAGPLDRRPLNDFPDAAPREVRREPQRSWNSIFIRMRDEISRISGLPAWRWPAWLALLVASGCALALVRLAVAVALAHRYRSASRPLADPALLEILSQIRRQAGCQRTIELKASDSFGSAATMGWLRPVIILPADWRSWSPDELRAVLAHEVAHVARGDFVLGLLAQLGVALHFYNPLVHWLSRRLRLEQEMAADVWAAQLLGSRQKYLTALAQMALRASDPPIAWAMRPFLPTRGTLMRRVEMLHREKILPRFSISSSRRFALAAIVLLVGLFVAGLRGPNTVNIAGAAPPEKPDQQAGEPFNLDYVPNDAVLVLALHPDRLATHKALAPILSLFAMAGLAGPLDLPPDQIEEVKLIFAGELFAQPGPWQMLVIKSKKPHDWTKLGNHFTGTVEKVTESGQEYYRAVGTGGQGQWRTYWLPDDRTLVLAPPDRITSTFSLRKAVNQPVWAGEWKKISGADAAMMITGQVFQPFVAGGAGGINLADVAGNAFFSGNPAGEQLEVKGTLACRSPEVARQLAASLLTTMKPFGQKVKQDPGVGALLGGLIETTKITADGAVVHSVSQIAPGVQHNAAQAIDAAAAAARRNQSTNQLKFIGVAMLNYHDVFRRFPSSVIVGPDGKTPHSWRVELLPFFEGKFRDLYKQYKMDEPWDSPNNLKVMEAGAEAFSAPTDPPSADCAYFMLVGPGTPFDPAAGPPSIRKIIDGTSKTIGLVEAKRAISWTKPEDIEYDPAKPLPEFGGIHPGGYHVGLLDASVRFVPDNVDEKILRAMITSIGREVVEFPAEPRPAAAAGDVTTEAGRRNESVQKLKQMGLALHNYHDKNKRFPPAVVMGPDGKTPHSWRVELLPYFSGDVIRRDGGQVIDAEKLQSLYKQYKMDEPWDSENNLKIVQAGAHAFAVPSDNPNDDCGYFFATGPGTIFDTAGPPPNVRNITDGLSRTIAVVEAKRSIPWTKPEDVEFDPNKPLPKLGGFFSGGFNTLFADGSVHFLPDNLDEKVLRALLTSSGGEVLAIDPQQGFKLSP